MEHRRGNQKRGNEPKNAWNVPKRQSQADCNVKAHNRSEREEAERRFQAAKAKLEQSVQKHLSTEYDHDSSSEEEELQVDSILGSVLKSYSKTSSETVYLGRTQQFLEDVFQSGAATCLICISTVKRTDAIWSCEECYCFFHLPCIQRWAADSIAQQKRTIEDFNFLEKQPELLWGCPKCRHDYKPAATPQKYTCFCGQEQDPLFQPWLVPHSCGESCNKALQPLCGHKCLLLCHPGPCPPCPQTVRCSCYCGQSAPQAKRCSDKEWSCRLQCRKLLGCNKHKCEELCHDGVCKSCPRTSKQQCQCGAKSREQPCAVPVWQCNLVCGKHLSCGHHTCEKVCHSANCGPCPLSGLRSCPCGKNVHPSLPCNVEAPTCGDTCGRLLACNVHKCQQRCHKEQCGACLQVMMKSCRCGLHEREMPCLKEYLCEVKCKRNRSCLRHPCNRKCCDGQCPSCEKICGKMLGCGKHKCSAICHRGPCYPCPLTEIISCNCGDTKLILPCGRKKHLKPPKCNKNCRNPPDCHHAIRSPHKCHAGECPPCKQTCNLKHSSCSHVCPASCHSAVWVTTVINGDKPLAGPWEKREAVREMKSLPCPNCLVLVSVTCLGRHETSNWPCHLAAPSACGRLCGRRLACANHQCTFPCHTVKGAESEVSAGENCCSCESACALPRPQGCTHLCFSPCHPAPCKPCTQLVRLKCHCGLNQLHRTCDVWTNAMFGKADAAQSTEKLLCCGNQCPKNYDCGHRCRVECHSGDCPDPQLCQKKVKVPCPCKRLRKEFPCELVRNGKAKVSCDDVCKLKLHEQKVQKEQEEEKRRKEQERKEKEELEKFEKWQQGKKKQRERKRRLDDTQDQSVMQKYGKFIAIALAVAFVMGFSYNLLIK